MRWPEYFMRLAHTIKLKSKDPTTQVGALAVGPDNEVLETGYNGLPRGVEDHPSRMERPQKYLWTAHAEENLVSAAARKRLKGSTVYVTHLCCARCARKLINAGVSKIVCGSGTTSMPDEEFEAALEMLKEARVALVQMKDEALHRV